LGGNGWHWNPFYVENGVVLMKVVVVEGLLGEESADEVFECDEGVPFIVVETDRF
jgi:hypothetical protein